MRGLRTIVGRCVFKKELAEGGRLSVCLTVLGGLCPPPHLRLRRFPPLLTEKWANKAHAPRIKLIPSGVILLWTGGSPARRDGAEFLVNLRKVKEETKGSLLSLLPPTIQHSQSQIPMMIDDVLFPFWLKGSSLLAVSDVMQHPSFCQSSWFWFCDDTCKLALLLPQTL
ncbi:putative STE20-related kinase adapter protein, partial [Naja naja]